MPNDADRRGLDPEAAPPAESTPPDRLPLTVILGIDRIRRCPPAVPASVVPASARECLLAIGTIRITSSSRSDFSRLLQPMPWGVSGAGAPAPENSEAWPHSPSASMVLYTYGEPARLRRRRRPDQREFRPPHDPSPRSGSDPRGNLKRHDALPANLGIPAPGAGGEAPGRAPGICVVGRTDASVSSKEWPMLPGQTAPAPGSGSRRARTNLPTAVPRLGRVRLQVADLDRSLAWYGRVIGLEVRDVRSNRAVLGAGALPPSR